MWLSTSKHLLIRPLVLELLWVSYTSIEIMAILDFGDALITWGWEVKIILLKMYVD